MFNLDVPLLNNLFELYESLTQTVITFPKTKKYTLGQKIDHVTLEIIELTITAGYLPKYEKLPQLQKASIKLDLLKILTRLAWKTKCLNNNRYQILSSQLSEIGKMIGGWIKTVKD